MKVLTYGEQQTCDKQVTNAKRIHNPPPAAADKPNCKWIISTSSLMEKQIKIFQKFCDDQQLLSFWKRSHKWIAKGEPILNNSE